MTTDALEPSGTSAVAGIPAFAGSRVFARLVREPLVHFLLLGTIIFALNAIISPAIPPEKKIEVTSGLRQTIVDTFKRDRGRAPTQAELKDLLDTWVLNEITYREALAQGFDKGDDMIRDRLTQKMRLLIFSNLTVGDPTPAQLQQWLDTHRARYDVPKRVTFFEVPIGLSQAEAEKTLHLIDSGTEPESVRLRAHSFQDRPVDSLIGGFSQQFIDGLLSLTPLKWEMLQSADGWHIVRLDAVVPARRVGVDEVRDPLLQDWRQEQARLNAVATVRKMGKSYIIAGADQP
jgi:hypothetical protein